MLVREKAALTCTQVAKDFGYFFKNIILTFNSQSRLTLFQPVEKSKSVDDFKSAMAKIQTSEPSFDTSQLADNAAQHQQQIAWKSQFTRSAASGDFTQESVKSFTKWMHETYCATYEQHLKVKLQKHT